MLNFPDLSHPLAKASNEVAFNQALIELAGNYLSENPHANLTDVTRWLPSVYPGALFRAFKSNYTRAHAHTLIKSMTEKSPVPTESSTVTCDPVPHPLDSEWRFTPQTTTELLQRMSRLSTPSTMWVGLGTPSILRAKDNARLNNKMILLDANPALARLLPRHVKTGTAIICDLIKDPIPAVAGELVVIDAPWYYEEMAAFLWASRQICPTGGRVLLTTPKVGTRPGIGLELRRLAEWINELGFVVERFEPDVINYESPFFEKNALRAEGIFGFPENWRRADLLTLRAKVISFAARPRSRGNRQCWQEIALGTMRLRILEGNSRGFRDPTLHALSVRNRPVNVSRRDARKKKANVWTSGNRIFNCLGSDLLLPIAQAVASGRSARETVEAVIGRPLRAIELARVDISVRQLKRLAQTENSERLAENQMLGCSIAGSKPHSVSDTLQVHGSFLPEMLGASSNVGIHVGVFVQPFLNFILEGTKTIESRFSITRRAPFEQVDTGDLILLKESGGPIVGSCRVSETWFYRIEPNSWSHIRREFAQAICAQGPQFWAAHAHTNYATLLRIEDVRAFTPINFLKKDRRGWVVIRPSQRRAGAFSHDA